MNLLNIQPRVKRGVFNIKAISMSLPRQQKIFIVSLIFYWPALFILAHIPIPHPIREADVSDKGLHFLAYLILTFLLWSAINPNKKVSWRPRVFLSKTRAGAWWILIIVLLYAICDEALQSFVQGRNCDIRDLVADLAGSLTGLILLSIFISQPAFLVVTGITIFGLTNISRVNIADLLPVANIIFHFFAYALFTLLWIQYIRRFPKLVTPKRNWLIAALILPAGLLITVILGSLFLGRSVTITDIIVSATGIVAVVGITFVFGLWRNQISKIKFQS
jgi:VanZ family protein